MNEYEFLAYLMYLAIVCGSAIICCKAIKGDKK